MEESDNYLDAEQYLLGGIESGISRGQSLKEAMISLYNSGYEKKEIEKAAKTYLDLVNKKSSPGIFPNDLKNESFITQDKKEDKKDEETREKPKDPIKPFSNTPQIVSSYGGESIKEAKKKVKELKFKKKDYSQRDPDELRGKAATFLLIGILVFLLIALVSVFLFKDELVRFINNLFG